MTDNARYIVKMERDFAWIIDTLAPAEKYAAGSFSSVLGPDWEPLAVAKCAELNAAHVLRMARERAALANYRATHAAALPDEN